MLRPSHEDMVPDFIDPLYPQSAEAGRDAVPEVSLETPLVHLQQLLHHHLQDTPTRALSLTTSLLCLGRLDSMLLPNSTRLPDMIHLEPPLALLQQG